jgi:hypothetical protein
MEEPRAVAEISYQMRLGMAIMATAPIYLVVQIWFACAWRGGWRIAALTIPRPCPP